MPDIDTDRLICIVVGVQLRAELGDRPLAYRIEQELRQRLEAALGKPAEGEPPRLAPVVLSDVYYLNNDELQARPAISVGGPGMNALSAMLVNDGVHTHISATHAWDRFARTVLAVEFEDLGFTIGTRF